MCAVSLAELAEIAQVNVELAPPTLTVILRFPIVGAVLVYAYNFFNVPSVGIIPYVSDSLAVQLLPTNIAVYSVVFATLESVLFPERTNSLLVVGSNSAHHFACEASGVLEGTHLNEIVSPAVMETVLERSDPWTSASDIVTVSDSAPPFFIIVNA